MLTDGFIRVRSASVGHDPGTLREPPLLEVVVQRRDQLTPGQIARGAKDHQGDWITFIIHDFSFPLQPFSPLSSPDTTGGPVDYLSGSGSQMNGHTIVHFSSVKILLGWIPGFHARKNWGMDRWLILDPFPLRSTKVAILPAQASRQSEDQ
jgi:hypothetical protein